MTTSKLTPRLRKEKYLVYIGETKKIVDAHESGEISAEEAHQKFNELRNPLFD